MKIINNVDKSTTPKQKNSNTLKEENIQIPKFRKNMYGIPLSQRQAVFDEYQKARIAYENCPRTSPDYWQKRFQYEDATKNLLKQENVIIKYVTKFFLQGRTTIGKSNLRQYKEDLTSIAQNILLESATKVESYRHFYKSFYKIVEK